MYPTLVSWGPVVISSYGVMLLLAFLAGAFVIWKRGREEHFEEEDLFDATLLTVFWGLLGARVVYVATHFSDFGADVLKMVALTRFPGLNFLGALTAGVVLLLIYSSKKKWNFFEIADVFVLGLSLAQVLAFVGAFLNGSGYGTRVSLPWAVAFPGVEGSRHPVQIYAALLFLGLYLVLNKVFLNYRTYQWYKAKETEAKAGLTFFVYLLGFGFSLVLLALLSPKEHYLAALAVEVWVGLGVLVLAIVGGYARSGRSLQSDTQLLVKKLGRRLTNKQPLIGKSKFKMTRKRQKRKRGITAGVDVK